MKSENNSFILVYVTTDSEYEAIKLSKLSLEKRLAACSNIIDHSKSFYWWNNEINEGKEYIILFKTTLPNESKLIKKIIGPERGPNGEMFENCWKNSLFPNGNQKMREKSLEKLIEKFIGFEWGPNNE